MGRVFLYAQQALDAYRKRNDVAVHPATQRPELLLLVFFDFDHRMITYALSIDYYGDTFFKSAGTELSPYVIQIILGAVSLVGTLPALYLIETWGRRRVCVIQTISYDSPIDVQIYSRFSLERSSKEPALLSPAWLDTLHSPRPEPPRNSSRHATGQEATPSSHSPFFTSSHSPCSGDRVSSYPPTFPEVRSSDRVFVV